MTAGAVLVVSAALSSVQNRGRVHRWLASLGGGGTQLQQAAVISSLLGDSFADLSLKRARSSFYAVPFSELEENFFGELPGAPIHTKPTRAKSRHAGWPHRRPFHREETTTSPQEQPAGGRPEADVVPNYAGKELVQCTLGECDAFVSHAHVDETFHRGEKYSALKNWAARAADTSPLLWLDGVCLRTRDMQRTLPLLPIFLVGCKRFVALAGSQYSSRLWTTMELFTFVQTGGTPANIVTLPIGDVSAGNLLATFDVRLARCASARDQETLLAVVEASFGDLRAFNEVMHALILTDEQEMQEVTATTA